MPVPFESLLPYAVCITMFVVSGVGLGEIRRANNGGKRHRYGVGYWDTCMMDRDRRLTGFLRGQTDKVEAPAGFEVNNPWKVEYLVR